MIITQKNNKYYCRFQLNGIRHTVGTRLTKNGIPINVVQNILAHTDIRTTMRYVHVQDNSIKEAITTLNNKWIQNGYIISQL